MLLLLFIRVDGAPATTRVYNLNSTNKHHGRRPHARPKQCMTRYKRSNSSAPPVIGCIEFATIIMAYLKSTADLGLFYRGHDDFREVDCELEVCVDSDYAMKAW